MGFIEGMKLIVYICITVGTGCTLGILILQSIADTQKKEKKE